MTPWRDRPHGVLRGYVEGSMVGGWLCTVLYVVLLVASRDLSLLWSGIPFVGIALFGTFMWRGGASESDRPSDG